MTYTLRSGTIADIEAVLKFWLDAAEPTNRADTREAVETLVLRDPDALILAVEDDEIIGCVIAGWDGWRCHLYRLAVRPDRRRRGVGTALLDAAERRFSTAGGRRADAMVLDDNDLGRRTWQAAGYARQPEWSRWIKAI